MNRWKKIALAAAGVGAAAIIGAVAYSMKHYEKKLQSTEPPKKEEKPVPEPSKDVEIISLEK